MTFIEKCNNFKTSKDTFQLSLLDLKRLRRVIEM